MQESNGRRKYDRQFKEEAGRMQRTPTTPHRHYLNGATITDQNPYSSEQKVS
jgi:hypothetical protein